MKLDQIPALIAFVVGDGVEIDTLSAIMLGPDMVEIKARRTDTHQWFQGTVHLSDGRLISHTIEGTL